MRDTPVPLSGDICSKVKILVEIQLIAGENFLVISQIIVYTGLAAICHSKSRRGCPSLFPGSQFRKPK